MNINNFNSKIFAWLGGFLFILWISLSILDDSQSESLNNKSDLQDISTTNFYSQPNYSEYYNKLKLIPVDYRLPPEEYYSFRNFNLYPNNYFNQKNLLLAINFIQNNYPKEKSPEIFSYYNTFNYK